MFESAHICRESLHRCNADPQFLDSFYKRFMSSSDEVREKFAKTDLKKQKEVLGKSLHMILLSCGGHDEADAYLAEIAKRHGHKDLNIPSYMYDLWLDSLIATVAATDPQHTPEIEQAWRETMSFGIQYMIENA